MKKIKGKIIINEIAVYCTIGVSEQERSKKQEILISLMLELNNVRAHISDRLEDTVNYRNVYQDVLLLAEQSKFHLLEALATSIANKCLEYTGVSVVTVTVTKSKILENARGVTIEVTKTI